GDPARRPGSRGLRAACPRALPRAVLRARRRDSDAGGRPGGEQPALDLRAREGDLRVAIRAEQPSRLDSDPGRGDRTAAGGDGSFTIDDPYAFMPALGELDVHLSGEGRHEELYERLGAHVREMGPHPPVRGTAFAVWAPAARAISVVGDFNSWDGRLHAMRSLGSSGIWELFLPGVEPGVRYKYEILTADGEISLKADPYAQEAERPPKTASVVFQSQHRW